jgi:hypothetical protein
LEQYKSEVLTKALVMLAKMRGTTVEYEVMRYMSK